MINLAVINLKTILKKIIKLSIVLCIIIVLFNCFKVVNFKSINISSFSIVNVKNIEKNIILAKYFENENLSKESNVRKILVRELALFTTTEEKLMEKENMEEALEFENLENKTNEDVNIENNFDNASTNTSENIEETENINQKEDENSQEIISQDNKNINLEEIPALAKTTVINEKNKVDKYTDVYKSVKIKNESKYTLTENMLTPDYDLANKKDIIIFHTHTCESYTKGENDNFEESGNFRTTNLDYNVASVGTELTNLLNSSGYNVIHSLSFHDYPAYTGSYSRSLKTVQNLLSQNPYTELIIDLHRDALGNDSSYGPTVKIDEEIVAQLMFVIGTDGGGLEHDNWNNNLKTAIKIQEKAEEMYPGLFKPIILRNSRYNQNVSNGACIIEVGATGNTIQECKGSMKYLAKVIAEVMK